MNLPLVSIIILNYKGKSILCRCLKTVLETTYSNYEIILVDNGSGKKETDYLKRKYGKDLILILNDRNCGYALGNNIGAKRAKGKYLVFLNNDTLVPKEWLKKAIQYMESHQKVGFLQPKIKSLGRKEYFEYAGGAGGYLDYFGYPFVRGRIFGLLEEDIGQYEDIREILWASGVALFARRKVFEDLKGFDPLFFAYAEENDLCFRGWRYGKKSVFVPFTEVFHQGGGTSNRDIPRKIFFIHRNHIILLLKNLKVSEMVIVLPIRFLMDFVTFIYYWLKYESRKESLAIIRAYLSLGFHLKTIISERLKDKWGHFGYPTKYNLVYKQSIVFDYFIRHKGKWGEIIENRNIPSKCIKIF